MEFDRLMKFLQSELMNEWEEFSETASDHAKNPRNLGEVTDANGYGRITGPCEDSIEIWLKVQDDVITQIGFSTDGCGSTAACGSMVTELAKGKSWHEARGLLQDDVVQALGGLPQANIHCALLAAHTLHAAIDDYSQRKGENAQ